MIALCFAVLVACPGPARAEHEPYSKLEEDVIREVLDKRKLSLEPEPEGKRIESITIERLEVFDERDPVPDFFNVFHVTSRERVIRRELLFAPGDAYRAEVVDESARILRGLRQLSLVLIVPTRGERPDGVRVLVIVKDVWSLRLNSDIEVGGNGLNYLLLNPSEENLLGLHTSLGGLFILEPDTYSIGAIASHARILGTRLGGLVAVNLIFNRDSGNAEGSNGEFTFGKLLHSLDARWGWATSFQWDQQVTRRLIDGRVRLYDAPSTSQVEAIPQVYDTEEFTAGYTLTRSFGRSPKTDLSVGAEASRLAYRPRVDLDVSATAKSEFERDVVPRSDTRIGPFIELHQFAGRYEKLLDLMTLGLQEDYRRGADVLLRLAPALRAWGSSRDSLKTDAALAYTLFPWRGLARGVAWSTIEVSGDGQHAASIELALFLATPRLGFGRFVSGGLFVNRYLDGLNAAPLALGGDNRLRGYRIGEFLGNDVATQSLEFRSASVDILSAQVGFALFYDAGGAADRVSDLVIRQGAGLGLRILFPQVDRLVLRADWGFPLAADHDPLPGTPFVTFGQAFDQPGILSPSVASTR